MTEIVKEWDDVKVSTGEFVRGNNILISIFKISKSSTLKMSVSSGLMKLENPDYVVLGYSKKYHALLLFFVPDNKHHGAIKIFKRSTGLVAIQSFLNSCELDRNQLIGKYAPVLEQISLNRQAWVVYLDKKMQPVKPKIEEISLVS